MSRLALESKSKTDECEHIVDNKTAGSCRSGHINVFQR